MMFLLLMQTQGTRIKHFTKKELAKEKKYTPKRTSITTINLMKELELTDGIG